MKLELQINGEEKWIDLTEATRIWKELSDVFSLIQPVLKDNKNMLYEQLLPWACPEMIEVLKESTCAKR